MAKSVTFQIGGNPVEVPVLTLYVLQERKNDLQSLGPNMNWIDYASTVTNIIACALDKAPRDLAKVMTVEEMRNLGDSFLKLMEESGFQMGNEPAGDQAGIGT